MRAVDPAGPQYQVAAPRRTDCGFARQLGAAVNVERAGRVLLHVRRCLVSIEDVISRIVNEQRAETFGLFCDDPRRAAVDRHREVGFTLSTVDCGVGSGVHDDIRPRLPRHTTYRLEICKIQLSAVCGNDVANSWQRA